MIKTVLFDLDGTLADTALDLANALNEIRTRNNLAALPLETIRPSVSLGGNAMIKLAFDLDEGDTGFDEKREDFLSHYANNVANETKLFDGIEEVLNFIEQNGNAWGIVTNKSTWLTEPLISLLELDKRAACIVCGDTLEHRKPHPLPILHACKLTKTEPAESIYIGDAQRDIEAGIRAGTRTLVALYGYIDDNEDPEDWNADDMVSTPIEIIDKLKEFNY